jgi:hypothetical protein
MSAEENATAGKLALNCFDGGVETLLVAVGAAARWRSMGTELAKRQIAAEDGEAGVAEGVCYSDEEWRLAIRTCAVREDERVLRGRRWNVEIAANGRFVWARGFEWLEVGFRHGRFDSPIRCQWWNLSAFGAIVAQR